MATAWGGTRVVARGHRLRRRTQTVYNYVEDAYLRDDIPCGSELCTSCDNSKSRAALGTPPLKADASHYLVPDAQALLVRREPPSTTPYTTPVIIYITSSAHAPHTTKYRREECRRSSLTEMTHATTHGCFFGVFSPWES